MHAHLCPQRHYLMSRLQWFWARSTHLTLEEWGGRMGGGWHRSRCSGATGFLLERYRGQPSCSPRAAFSVSCWKNQGWRALNYSACKLLWWILFANLDTVKWGKKKSNFINKQRRQRERAKERQREPRLEKSFPFKLPFSNITSMYSYWLACKVNVIPHPIWWSFDSWRVPSFIHTLAWIQSSALIYGCGAEEALMFFQVIRPNVRSVKVYRGHPTRRYIEMDG